MKTPTRAMDQIAEKTQKHHVIVKYLINKSSHAYIDSEQILCNIIEAPQESDHIIIETFNPSLIATQPKVKLSAMLARFVELHCTFVKLIGGNKIELKVDSIFIAKKERNHPRFLIKEEGFVRVGSIASSKMIIEANMFNIPTLVRVSFEEFEKKLEEQFGPNAIIKVDVFSSELEPEYGLVKQKMKALYLEDCYSEESYHLASPEYINYAEEMDEPIGSAIKKFKDKQIRSRLLVPIIYINEVEEMIPIGFVSVFMKDVILTNLDVSRITTMLESTLQRIKESNVITTDAKFPVLDVSISGLRLQIDHENLIHTLPKQKGFIFDLIFKLQAPFRFAARIAWMAPQKEGGLMIGVEFINKARTLSERQRFEQNIEVVKQLTNQMA
ncbi:MAG: DUF1577 domain-containing protein [Leptospira sp.]|nr:DUF1577 domain-containing protein [Leptospira sp.]